MNWITRPFNHTVSEDDDRCEHLKDGDNSYYTVAEHDGMAVPDMPKVGYVKVITVGEENIGELSIGEVCTYHRDCVLNYNTVVKANGVVVYVKGSTFSPVLGFDKESLIIAVKESPQDLIMLHGAAMVIRGIKNHTGDIDVKIAGIPLKTYVKNRYGAMDKDSHIVEGSFDYGILGRTQPEIYYNEIDGVMVQTIDNIVTHKKALGRDKDFAAINLIKKFQNK